MSTIYEVTIRVLVKRYDAIPPLTYDIQKFIQAVIEKEDLETFTIEIKEHKPTQVREAKE